MTDMLTYERECWDMGCRHVIGMDEAGRGPLAGPVVVAGVVFEPETIIEGVTDSKQLSEQEREKFFEMIRERATAFHVEIVNHETIDKINILQASLYGMRQCADLLTVKPDFILVDGNKLPFPDHHAFGTKQRAIVKGDSKSFSIAAASILAKVTRDRLMNEYDPIFPQYNFARHKGYPTPEHIRAIKEYGLSTIHRKTFCMQFLQEQLGFGF